MNETIDKKLKIAMIIAILGIISIFAGSTYAIFSKAITSDKKQVIKSGVVKLELTEETNGLEFSNFTAMSDADGLLQEETYNFTLKNSGDTNAKYKIILEDKNTTSIDIKYVKVGLELNGKEKGPMNLKEVERIIDEGALKQGKTNTYKLRLWIDNSQSENLDSLVDKGISFKIKVVAEQYFDKIKEPTGAEVLIKKVETDGLVAETHPATTQLAATTDYRYTGKDPNNYIKFNNEVWRIIGVFDVDNGTGKLEKRIKIIRDSIGNKEWNIDNTGVGLSSNSKDAAVSNLIIDGNGNPDMIRLAPEPTPGGGDNNWTQATGMKLLNSGDYWNRTGSYASTGLTEEAKNQIADAKWYLGGTDQYSTTNATQFYLYERGTTVYDSTKPTSWVGKVGLMYLSDYGYATAGGATTNRDTCLAKEMFYWDGSSVSDCKNNDWLYDSSNMQWTLTLCSGGPGLAFYVDSDGGTSGTQVFETKNLRPTVYLSSDIQITGGSGTSSSPYEISG